MAIAKSAAQLPVFPKLSNSNSIAMDDMASREVADWVRGSLVSFPVSMADWVPVSSQEHGSWKMQLPSSVVALGS
jgi:hypothetical protein